MVIAPADRAKQYIEKARQADERAARTSDPRLKENWAHIADSYREMAKTARQQ
jgi:hypothetical protein